MKRRRIPPLVGGPGEGTICPPGGRRCPIFLARYPASRSFLICFSWMLEAIHLTPAPDPDIFRRPLWAEKTNAQALELQRRGMDREEEGVGEKEGSLSLYKGGRNYAPPYLPSTRLFPKHRD